MARIQQGQIVLTHWNAGAFRVSSLPQLLPELAVYSLLYDEVLIREEDLITNRAITRLLTNKASYAIFSELLASGIVKLLRLPLEIYPPGRRFDPVLLPISARAEEHEIRRSYKGRPWKPTKWEWRLFRELDDLIVKSPSASRYHLPFEPGNPFADNLLEILENLESYRIGSHPVFSHLHKETARQFIGFCRDPESWRRFLHDRGMRNPILGPDTGFFRTAAYQCSEFLPTQRAIRRLVESVYAAIYCKREGADGRYGGSELVELPYRYQSEAERDAAVEEAVRIGVVPTEAAATVTLHPGIAEALSRTRASSEFRLMRQTVDALGDGTESPLLIEGRFREAWRNLCEVYADNAARCLKLSGGLGFRLFRFTVYAYVLARVLGLLVVPSGIHNLDLPALEDAAAIAAMEKLGPKMLCAFRGLVKIPSLRGRMEASADIRMSNVPLAVSDKNTSGAGD